MNLFNKKPVSTEPTGTEKLRQHLRARTRHWSLVRIAEDINEAIAADANRAAAKSIAGRMAGDGASPEVAASLAKTLIGGGFSSQAKREVTSAMLESFLEGGELPNLIKMKLAENLHSGHQTYDADLDQIVSAYRYEPHAITATPPQWVHPDPAVAKAQAEYQAALKAARRR